VTSIYLSIYLTSQWWDDWQSSTVVNSTLVADSTIGLPGFGIGDCCWIAFEQARATVMQVARNGVSPTMDYVAVEKSRQWLRSSLS